VYKWKKLNEKLINYSNEDERDKNEKCGSRSILLNNLERKKHFVLKILKEGKT
jgi:hypothetical protein